MPGDNTNHSALRELVEKPINWGVDLINSRKFNDIINAFNPGHKDIHLDKVTLVNKKDQQSANSLLDQADKAIGNCVVWTGQVAKTSADNLTDNIGKHISHNQAIQSAVKSKLARDTGNVLNETGHLAKEVAVGGFDFLVQGTAAGIAQIGNHKDSPEVLREKLTLFKPEEAQFGSNVDIAHKIGAIGSVIIPCTTIAKVGVWGVGAIGTTIKAVQFSPTMMKIAAPITAVLASPTVQQQLDKVGQACARVGQPINNFLVQHPAITNNLDKAKQALDISKPANQALAAGGVFAFLQPVKDSHNQLPERSRNCGLTMFTGAVFRGVLGTTSYGAGAAEAAKQGAKAVTLNAIKDRAIFASVALPTGLMSTLLHATSEARLATPQELANASLFSVLSVAATIPRSTARLFEKTPTQKPSVGANTNEQVETQVKVTAKAQTNEVQAEVKAPAAKAQTNETQTEVKAPIAKAQAAGTQPEVKASAPKAEAQSDTVMPVVKKVGTKIEPTENILKTFKSGDEFRNHRNFNANGEKGSLINSPFGKAVAEKVEQIKFRPRVTTTNVPALQKSIERVARPEVEQGQVRSFSTLGQANDRPIYAPIAVKHTVAYSLDPKYGNANNPGSLISAIGQKAAIPEKIEYGNLGKSNSNSIYESLRGYRAKPGETPRPVAKPTKEEVFVRIGQQRSIDSIYKPGEEFGNPSNIPNINGKALGLRFSYLGDKAETMPTWKLTSKRGTGELLLSRVKPMPGLYIEIDNPRYTGSRSSMQNDLSTPRPLLKATKAGDFTPSQFATGTFDLLRYYQDNQIGNINLNSRYFSESNTYGTLTETFQGKIKPPCHLERPLDCFSNVKAVSNETIAEQTRLNLNAAKVTGTWHNVDAIHKGLPGLLKSLRPTKNPDSAIKPHDEIWLGKNSKTASDNVSAKNGAESKNAIAGHESKVTIKNNKPSDKDSAHDTTHGAERKISSPKLVNHPRVHAERLESALKHKQKLAETIKPSEKRHRETRTKLKASNILHDAQDTQKALSLPNKIEAETIDYGNQSKPTIFKPYQSHHNIPAFDPDTYLTKPGGLLNTTLADHAINNRPVTLIPGRANEGTSLAKSSQKLEVKLVDQGEFNLQAVPTAEETLGMLRLTRSNPSRTIYSELSAQELGTVNEIPPTVLPQRIGAGLEIRNPRFLDTTNTVKPLSETFAPKIQGEADASVLAPRGGYKMPTEAEPATTFVERVHAAKAVEQFSDTLLKEAEAAPATTSAY